MNKNKVWLWVTYLALTLFAIILVLPFYYMVVTSFKATTEVTRIPISLAIQSPELTSYRVIIGESMFVRAAWNSLLIASALTLGNMVLCPLAGYAFAKHRFPGRDAIFTALLATMMIPGSVLLVPGFLLFRDLGWLDSWLPLIIPGLVGIFGVFLSRQFITTIPDDLIDAARIDGCSEFRIYSMVIMPLSQSLLATLAIFTFLGSWNSFISPLIYLLDEEKFTLPLVISLLQGRFRGKENVQMAGAVLSILPVLLVFFFFQKQIVRSLANTGLKE
jgi:multiple sugar transport system permease protein